MTTKIAMTVALVMLVGACGAEEPMPTCEPRLVDPFGPGEWEAIDLATCGELLTREQITERCADGGEYFQPECPGTNGGVDYPFRPVCGATEPVCDGTPYGVASVDATPVCVDVCPNIR